MKKRHVWSALLLVCCIVSLVACTSEPTPTQFSATPSHYTALPSPTAITLPAGTLLYQADWSHGLSGWPNTYGWKMAQGQLEIATSGTAMLTIPYRPVVPNYMIEIRLRIVSLIQEMGGQFGFFATRQHGKDGFQAGVCCLMESKPRAFGSHPSAGVAIDPCNSCNGGYGIDYEPGFHWHTYSVKVQDNEVLFLDEGVSLGYSSSNQTDYLSNGPLGLTSWLVVLRISSIRIVSV